MSDSDSEQEVVKSSATSKGADDVALNSAVIEPMIEFYKNATNFLNHCDKPKHNQFIEVLKATGLGFVVMGFVGYMVKLVHIPVNQILVGA